MSSVHNRQSQFDRPIGRRQLGSAATADLILAAVANACPRFPALKEAGKAAHIEQLIAAGAWTDAALGLIELECPTWKLRRLVYDDGEWFCSLSKELNLPAEFDDTADARHQEMSLAILLAFAEARRKDRTQNANSTTAPWIGQESGIAICCDNFA